MSTRHDVIGARTPMRCPICEGALEHVLIRDIGGVTAGLVWQIHAGECPQHGWFQAEVISRPPREIFPVVKPFGAARRLEIDGKEIYAFPTAFSELPPAEKRRRIDPFDPQLWRVSRRADATGETRLGRRPA